MKQRGFTLIELLAVIVILAVIAVITVPMIIGTINKSKEQAFKDSSLSIFSAAELYVVENSIEKTDENGIEISKLKLKNKNQFLSGLIFYENNKIKIEYVSDGVFCANGYIDNITIEKKACFSDSDAPSIYVDLESSDWVKSANINVLITDQSKIEEIKYKIVKNTEDKDNVEWTTTTDTKFQIPLTEGAKYKVYIYSKDSKNNYIEKEYGEYKIEYYDSFEILATYAGLNFNDYSSTDELLSNRTLMDKIVSTDKSLNYMIEGASSSKTQILNGVLENINATDSIINSKNALIKVAQNSLWLSSLKSSSFYVSTYVSKILSTSVLTNVEKYNLKLPCYLYNNGLTNFSWSQFSGMNTMWCGNYDSACRVGSTGTGSKLGVYDTSGSYYMGAGLQTGTINLSNYSNIKFYYVFNGVCSGSSGQYGQEIGAVYVGNSHIWATSYKCSNLSGWVTQSIGGYGNQPIKVFSYAGGLTNYTTSFEISSMYLY